MREVKGLKHLPWLVLVLLFAGGSALWFLFVGEQQTHLRLSFVNLLERTSDQLLRNRLQGGLEADGLPEGIRGFAIYDAQGRQAAAWGEGAPAQIDPGRDLGAQRQILLPVLPGPDRWVGFLKALEPLRPRMELWDDDGDEGPRPPGPGPAPGMGPRRVQGFLFVSLSQRPLESRLAVWTLAGAAGVAAWGGFLAFVGVLWFRARRYREAVVQHRELLQYAEASRTLGHELQNPLAAILLQTALLRRAAGAEVAPEVGIIEEEARRISALVARVRDFLKDPKGQAQRVDLAELAGGLTGRFAVPIAFEAEGPGPYPVRFDPHRLRSVVENLLKNAVESGPDPRPRLGLSRPRAGWVRLEVADSGAGFTAESLDQALDPFYTTKTTGTGIGLSIADSFVRAAGGRLKLENRPEGGARVTLDLPEAPEETT